MPTSKKEYFVYTINNVAIQTVYDLLKGKGAFIDGFSSSADFLSYDAGTGITNRERILANYSEEEKTKVSSNDDEISIVYGTSVLVPFSKISRDILPIIGDSVASNDVISFLSSQLRSFYNDPKYVRAFKFERKALGSYKEIFNHVSVWLWSKGLSSKATGTQGKEKISYSDKIINITPFVSSITTNMGENGGTFNLMISPIPGIWDEALNSWSLDKNGLKQTKSGEIISQANIHDSIQNRKALFFYNIIQENDIVFIRFETLKSEQDRLDKKNFQFEIDKSELQFKSFDMICLVDNSQLSAVFENSDLRVSLYGRDLMKLLIEDGVYFYPFDYVRDGIFANETTDDRLVRYDGQLLGRFQSGFRTIENSLKFIINALGTIQICSDTLFSPYQNEGGKTDRRSKKFVLDNKQKRDILLANQEVEKDSYQSCIDVIKQSRSSSGLSLKSESAEITQCALVYNHIFEFLSFLDENKNLTKAGTWFGIFYDGEQLSDNELPSIFFGSLFTSSERLSVNSKLLVKQTSESSAAIKECVYRYFLLKDRQDTLPQEEVEETPLKGIWQIVKLVIDKTVQKRILADASIGNEHGSLINAIRKVCQEPFVEFYGDTYGDQYYLTVRKPPFDKEGFLSMLDGVVSNENGVKVSTNPIIIDLYDDDIIGEDITYGGEAFSWYRLIPQGSFPGGDEMAFAYLRAIYLKEYADVFGSKPFDVATNYIPYQPFVSRDQSPNEAYMIEQGIRDLQYLIQSHAYLPFIRRGTVTLGHGDRRIKRGTLVRLVSTGEVGIVESVQNSAVFQNQSTDRTTIINIDRLMVERYIRGVQEDVDGKDTQVSYFNLVNTDIPQNAFQKKDDYVDFSKEICGKWKVNVPVFNFFLKAKQFR